MKKDNMLNESTIRRFMKLATIDGLTDKFVAENLEEVNDDVEEGMRRAKRDDEELEEGADEEIEEGKHEDDEKMEEGTDEELEESTDELDEMGEMPMDRDEEGEMDMVMDLGMDAEEPAAEAGGMVSVDQLMSALEKALEDVLGQEVEVSQDDEEEMDMMLMLRWIWMPMLKWTWLLMQARKKRKKNSKKSMTMLSKRSSPESSRDLRKKQNQTKSKLTVAFLMYLWYNTGAIQ